MAFAEANRAVVRYIQEIVWGTTPASGVVRTVRMNSSGLTGTKDTQVSEELRADRMVPGIIEVGAATEGSLSSELSLFSHDVFFEHFLLSSWSLPNGPMYGLIIKGASVTVTGASQITLVGGDYTDYLADNQYVKLEGFMAPANNGYFKINGTPSYTGGNTVITVDESSLVTEVGSVYTKFLDASDVILKSTSTAFTSGNTINGGGANSFAGQTLKVGQKLYLEGLGKETGSIQFNATNPTDGDEFSISDGVDTYTFEIRTDSGLVSPGNVHVALSNTPLTLLNSVRAAVNDLFRQQKLRVSARAGVSAGTKEAGSIVLSDTPVEADAFSVSDGATTVVFELDDGPDGVTAGRTAIDITGLNTDQIGAAMETAINASALNVTATYTAGSNTLDIVNDNYVGGAIVEVTDAGGDMAVTDFSGGVAPSLALVNQRGTGGAITESLSTITATNFSGGDATKFGFYTIASLPNDDTIVTEETLATDANSGSLTVVIKGSHLRNPGVVADITKKSISAETSYTDVDKNMAHDGLRLGTLDMGVSVGEICSCSFGFQGRETAPLPGGTVLGASPYTVLEAPATEPLNATANVGTISRDGVELASVTSLELSGDASLRTQRCVGNRFPTGIGYGRLSITGKFTAYFETFDLYNIFRNHQTVALGWDFEDADHNRMFFRLPAVKFSANPVAPSEGIDTDVMDPVEWTAQRDPVLNTMMMLDRFSSVYPSSVA